MATAVRADQYVELDFNIPVDFQQSAHDRLTVFFDLFDDRPLTTANFLQYVNNTVSNGSYNGTLVHRLSRNFVLQGGGYYPWLYYQNSLGQYSLDPSDTVDLDGNPATANPTVAGESGNSPFRSNLAGTVSMALNSGPNTANSGTSQWFVNLADNSFLDTYNAQAQSGPFTVFGKVAGDGMNLFNSYNSLLSITNLNPDSNGDGVRDGGPFGSSSSDGVPFYQSSLLVLQKAKQIDYLGNGLTTTVPTGGLTFSSRDAFIDTGTVFTGTGALTIGSGRTLGIREDYTLSRPLLNHGTLAPGLQIGSITESGSYAQYFDGTLDIDLRGTTVDTGYDRLNVTGSAYLDGTLNISFVSGFTPAAGNVFTVLTAGSIIGAFGSYELPQLSPGLVWHATQTSTSFALDVIAADYDHNGVVDAGDYVVWRKSLGKTVTKYTSADGNGDGIVNYSDYLIWRDNIGEVSGVSHGAGSGSSLESSNVPEPTSGLMAIFAALFFVARPRRRSA